MSLSFLLIKNPKDDETSIEASTQIFSSLVRGKNTFFKQLFKKSQPLSFEIYLINQTIYFYICIPDTTETYVTSLLSSSYPKSLILKTEDPLSAFGNLSQVGELIQGAPYYLPFKTYADFKDVDPLSPVLGFLAKQEQNVNLGIQILVTQASFSWQGTTIRLANASLKDPTDSTKTYTHPGKALMLKKAEFGGGKVAIRLFASTSNHAHLLANLAGTFSSFSLGEGNHLILTKPKFFTSKLINKIKSREVAFFERRNQILNAPELATLWHLPGKNLSGIRNIAWGKTLAGEPPPNLPASQSLADEEKQDTNFFAKTEFKNQETIFGIKTPDRRKHIYIIGKTGTGKSTLIANMAIDDIRKGRGVGIVDPHGDLSETILDFIPNRRLSDIVYLEPFDTERAFSLNVLEITDDSEKDLVASGIVSIFYKLYGNSWGPRLEYILRNVILTLLEIPNSTLVDVLRLLTDSRYQDRVIEDHLKDPVLRDFWLKEFKRMPDSMRAEAISPIQNKVGRFVASTMIRNIIGQPKSSIDFGKAMDEGKILILNLSQGKLGEDNAALLGAMFITRLQLAAMRRSFTQEAERRDFFLYVDEFQNFATHSFIKILSEARKYRLCLILANQYIQQLEEEVTKAIFGNVGTLLSFVVGAQDAKALSQEFGGIYTDNDMVSLGKYEVICKLSVDGMTSSPFPARTLPLPAVKNDNRQKIVELSKERFTRKVVPQVLPPKPVFRSADNSPNKQSTRSPQNTSHLPKAN